MELKINHRGLKVNHTCGHSSIAPPVNHKANDMYLAFIESRDCRICRHNHALELAKRYKLPALEGSVKQVLWAEDIRYETTKNLESIMKICSEDLSEEPVSMVNDMLIYILNQNQCEWWINHRSMKVTEKNFLAIGRAYARSSDIPMNYRR